MKKIIVSVPDRHCGKLINERLKDTCFAIVFFSENRIYCDAFSQRLRLNNSNGILRCKRCYKAEVKKNA